LLIGVQAVRVAAIQGLGGDVAEDLLWPANPGRVLDRELAAIGTAAGQGQAPSPSTLARVNQVALRDPLASQPFLIAGTAALAAGQRARGTQLLLAAVRHDPRDPSARLLLADEALRRGNLAAGMTHVAALARMLPGGAQPLAPALAAFASQPANAAALAPLLQQDPQLRDGVLSELAADPANADAVLRLAGRWAPPSATASPPQWQGRLVNALVTAGEFQKARLLWSRFAGTSPNPSTLTDPAFRNRNLPPPFGWTLTSGADGTAETADPAGLQIMFYGRNDIVLASQVTTLPGGTYRLSLRASGGAEQNGETLAWTVTCVAAKAPFARLPLQGAGDRALSMTFRVPATCPAQTLALTATSPEFPGTSTLNVSALRLDKVGS
jgi:hypothetical protein